MNLARRLSEAVRWGAGGAGLAAAAYAAWVGAAWCRYGRPAEARGDERDALLDRFLPAYDVAERHRVRVRAPAALVLAAAAEMDLRQSALVRAIFRARELALRAAPGDRALPRGLLAQMTALGWRVLAEEPGRELVVGAVAQPWLANVVFRGLTAEAFRAFQDPGHVKIAWTLRADPVSEAESIFRTETRVAATDPSARARFRWYWVRFSPGIALIRRAMLRRLRADAERRARS